MKYMFFFSYNTGQIPLITHHSTGITKEDSSDVEQKIVEIHKIESGWKKISQVHCKNEYVISNQ